MKEKPQIPYPQRPKEPIEMTSDELLDYALDPELAEEVKRTAKSPETEESERDC